MPQFRKTIRHLSIPLTLGFIAFSAAICAAAFTGEVTPPPNIIPRANSSFSLLPIFFLLGFYLLVLTLVEIAHLVIRKFSSVKRPFWVTLLALNILLLVFDFWMAIFGPAARPIFIYFALPNIAFSALALYAWRKNHPKTPGVALLVASCINLFVWDWYLVVLFFTWAHLVTI